MWFERRLTRRHHPLGAPLLLDAQLPNLLLPRMLLPPRLDPWLLLLKFRVAAEDGTKNVVLLAEQS